MKLEFIQVKYPDTQLLKQFIDGAGNSLKTFRYFQKRPLEVIKEHLCTFLLLDEKTPVAYGHLDVTNESVISEHCGDDKSTTTTTTTIWLGIAVSERYIGLGLGVLMMNKLIEYGRTHAVKQIKLSVDNDNGPAIGLYERLGFKLQEKKEKFSFYTLDLN